jgi:hypothetical protein
VRTTRPTALSSRSWAFLSLGRVRPVDQASHFLRCRPRSLSDLSSGTCWSAFGFVNPFSFTQSGVQQFASLGCRIHGRLDAGKSNAILFLTWFDGTSKELED